jgi:hypothetical protein
VPGNGRRTVFHKHGDYDAFGEERRKRKEDAPRFSLSGDRPRVTLRPCPVVLGMPLAALFTMPVAVGITFGAGAGASRYWRWKGRRQEQPLLPTAACDASPGKPGADENHREGETRGFGRGRR